MWEAWDANEHAHNLTDWSQEYDQFGQGGFYGRIDEIHLPAMQVFKEYTSHALGQQCNVWPDSLWIGIPAAAGDCRINGHRVGEREIMCQPGGHDFELVTPDAFGIYGLVVGREWLARGMRRGGAPAAGRRPGAADAPAAAAPDAPGHDLPDRAPAGPRGRRTRAPGASGHPRPGAAGYPARGDAQHRAPAQLSPPPPGRGSRPRPPGERRDAAVSLEELCEIAHVSQRTLRYSFTSILGVSPIQFLRLTRLNRVRRRLCEPEAETTVSQAAADWGFYHLGQFARDYRRLFGESPSATLARHRH